MKTSRFGRAALIWLAAVGLCLPQVGFAVTLPVPAPVVRDVVLSQDGVLHGRVINAQRSAVPGVPVTVRAQYRAVAIATTAPDGSFSVPGMKGGVYEIAAANGSGVYRVWSADAAPPVAQVSATIYSQDDAINGNAGVLPQGGESDGEPTPETLLTNPIFIAGVVATGIAVPVALSNLRSASP